ncbi:ArnT family glycosyltransferase [Brackiella oedipodis]|uniref:ArnT family glycosyltransferase n=1 Tax=Brackiella oedipodis TaxID=124225 RepID=UPI000684E565|nr:glycosyltransferase family 39 protein [Brackiella oedipodis]
MKTNLSSQQQIVVLIGLIVFLPLISMFLLPFYDTTEPRYAEIARIMAQSGDWITPWFNADTPFWGKPPLSFWCQALSIKLLGNSEFALRLPAWLCLVLSNMVIYRACQRLYNRQIASLALLIYSSCFLVSVCAAAVLTDPFLTLGTNLCLFSVAVVMQDDARKQTTPSTLWSYLFFIGLAIGLLAKGPLAAVISFAPIAIYCFNKKHHQAVLTHLPWVKGGLLCAALALPWYILAELKTPGFLYYFLVGEHILRFAVSGWKGDMYGTAHQQPFAMIWVYFLAATSPWSILALIAMVSAIFKKQFKALMKSIEHTALNRYWLSAMLFTPIFFTFSANILWTYVLPAIAAFSIYLALYLHANLATRTRPLPLLNLAALSTPLGLVLVSIVLWSQPNLGNTEKTLINYVQQHQQVGETLFYYSKLPFSAQYYSGGHAKIIDDNKLLEELAENKPFYLAVPNQNAVKLFAETSLYNLTVSKNKRFTLMYIAPQIPTYEQRSRLANNP